MQVRGICQWGIAAAAVLALVACEPTGFLPTVTAAERAASVRTFLDLRSASTDDVLRAGHTVRVAARVTDRLQLPVRGAPVAWSGAAGSGVVVRDTPVTTGVEGVVRGTWTAGTTAGMQEVVATIEGNVYVFDRASIVVYADTLVGTLELEPDAWTLAADDTTRVRITEARDQYGNAYDLSGPRPGAPPPVEFSSLDPRVASLVSTTARSVLVAGLAEGTARIVARSGGRADTVSLVVSPAMIRDSLGRH